MSKRSQHVYKSPSYYIKKRLFNNRPAVVGMMIIILAHVIAILGYLIMPDQTPYANDGAIQIGKQHPGFRITMMKIRRNADIPREFFLKKMFSGQPSPYTIIPITGYKISGLKVLAKIYSTDVYEEFDMVNVVKPLHLGSSNKFKTSNKLNYRIENDKIIYLDKDENIQQISKAELLEEFNENNIDHRFYLFGTDKAGRDMFSRLIFGTRISLAIGFISVIISLFVGVTLGSLAGFFGGMVDNLVMWLMTVVWSIPSIMLVIAISLALQSKGVGVAFIAVGLTTWVEIARVVRGQILSIKEKLYIEAARALGIRIFRIIYFHILPNMYGPLIVIIASNFATAILVEAGLSFLGLSVQPPMPSWGMMINEGYHVMTTSNSWHMVVMPSLCVSLLVLAFNLFGNGLRDAYDPQTVINKG